MCAGSPSDTRRGKRMVAITRETPNPPNTISILEDLYIPIKKPTILMKKLRTSSIF